MFTLAGKTALITGASSGLGEAIARAFHVQGAHVVLSGTREDALNRLAVSLGERVDICPANLLNESEAEELFARAEAKVAGGIDILVNNAGLTRDSLVIRMKDDAWSDVLKVDLESPFRLCRAALKSMLRRRQGRIINITSIVGATGNAGQVNYSAAKAGLIGMTKSLAKEAASRGVTVNAIAPGFIETPMTAVLSESQRDQLLTSIPLGRMGQPSDIAAASVYLASDAASWVTGTTLHINGGMAMI